MARGAWPAFYLLAALGACDAGHLGSPLLWPVDGARAALSNAAYAGRRGAVKRHLTRRRVEIRAGEARALAELWRISGVPAPARADVLRDLAETPDDQDWPENAAIAVMVRTR